MIQPVLSLINKPDLSDNGIMPSTLGAAGLFSLAPAITAKPLQHYGQGQEIKNFESFKRRLRPGDILITGGKEILPIPTGVNLVTGNPYGQHVSVVSKPLKNLDIDSHPAYGFNSTYGNIEKAHNLQALRFKDPEVRKRVLGGMRDMEKAVNIFEKEVKQRLIRKGWDSASAAAHAERATSALYDTPTGVKAGLKELFFPNLLSSNSVKNLNAENYLANRNFIKGVKSYSQAMADLLDSDASGNKLQISDLRKVLPKCSGGVCSSMPAILGQANIVPNRAARDILTSDYLKSDMLKPVARYIGGKPENFLNKSYFSLMSLAPKTLRSLPGLGLIGAGLGLALNRRQNKLENLKNTNSIIRNTTTPIYALLNRGRSAQA